jgi:hypothetical protein
MTAAIVALGVVVALLGVLVVGLLRSHADVLRALHEVGVGEDQLAGSARAQRAARAGAGGTPNDSGEAGSPGIRTVDGVAAPGATSALGRLVDIDGATPDGGAVRIGLDGARGATLLAFLSTGCRTCADFWRAFAADDLDRVPGESTRVVVVTRGPDEESPAAVAGLASPRVTTVMSSRAWDDYDVAVAPYFLLVDGERGVVGEGASGSWDQVVDLLGRALADAGMPTHRAAAGADWSRRDLLRGRARQERADRELAAAGIEPGSPQLYGPLHGPVDEAGSGDEVAGAGTQ